MFVVFSLVIGPTGPSPIARVVASPHISDALAKPAVSSAAPQLQTSTITGIAFRDYNNDGTNDSEEPGLSNITVTAYNAAGSNIGITTTDSSGGYSLTASGSGPYRIEFTGFPSYLAPSVVGSDSDTTVRFLPDGNASNIDLALHDPGEYCQANPIYGVSCFTNGDPLHSSNQGEPAVAQFEYLDRSGLSANSKQMHTNMEDVGAVYGLAYAQNTGNVYMSAVLKRHSGLGPDGIGAIYVQADYTDADSVSLFYDFGAAAGSVDSNADRFPGTGNAFGQEGPCLTCDNVDADAYPLVGTVGFGDIDVSQDGSTLHVVNLADRKVYAVDLPNGTSHTELPNAPWITGDICGGTGVARPWGVENYDGKTYVGLVCDGTNSTCTAAGGACSDLNAHVYSHDGTTWTSEVSFSLDYERSLYKVAASPYWHRWNMDYTEIMSYIDNKVDVQYPQPILADIEFDSDGSMILGFSDRSSFQFGYAAPDPTDNSYDISVRYLSSGDILRVGYDNSGTSTNHSTTYQLENNGTVYQADGSTLTGLSNKSPTGPGGREFYADEWTGIGAGNHSDVLIGSLVLKAGSNEVLATSSDAFEYYGGGAVFHSNTDGEMTDGVQVYQSDYDASDGSAAKAGGLGDLELFCEAAPLEIGNRVWEDTDGDGIQDPGEPAISGVTVELYNESTLVGTAVTDANGHYYFNDSNVAVSVQPNTNYEIRISTTQPAMLDYSGPSPANAGGASDINDQSETTNLRDSNGTLNGTTVVASITTGNAGENNHTYDFGFVTTSLSLGDLVWDDLDNDGKQDAGEAGFSGVTVQLQNTSGSVLQTTTTNGSGRYLFTNLAEGQYIVHIPASNFQGGALNGLYSSAPTESDPNTNVNDDNQIGSVGDDNGVNETQPDVNGISSGVVGLSEGNEPTGDDLTSIDADTADADSNLTVDFGFNSTPPPMVELGNLVWHDADNNGIFDAGESGIDDVTVELYLDGTTPGVDSAQRTTTTAGGGLYIFTSLPPGSYFVYIPAAEFQGGGDLESMRSSTVTTVNPNNDVDDDDGSGGGDENGLDDSAPSTNGIRTGVIVLDEATEPTGDDTSSNTLADADANMTLDLGFFSPVSLGNFVWQDLDSDGTQNEGSAEGISGRTVELFQADGITTVIDADGNTVSSDTTDSNGEYNFTNLLPGEYVVRVNLPEGFTPSIGGVDPDSDSSNNDSNGIQSGNYAVSLPVTLTSGGEPTDDGDSDANSNLSIDFGLVPTPDMALSKTPDPADLVSGGETIDYTIQIQNTGYITLTGVSITDTLPSGLTYVPDSSTIIYWDGAGNSGGTSIITTSHNVIDDLSPAGYDGNDSTTGNSWASDWIESNDDGTDSFGFIEVDAGEIWFNGGDFSSDGSIARSIDLQQATSVTLMVDYDSDGQGSSGADVYIEVYDGTSWHTSFIVDGSSNTNGTWVDDITAHINSSGNTQIRFRAVGSNPQWKPSGTTDLDVDFDNIRIDWTETSSVSGGSSSPSGEIIDDFTSSNFSGGSGWDGNWSATGSHSGTVSVSGGAASYDASSIGFSSYDITLARSFTAPSGVIAATLFVTTAGSWNMSGSEAKLDIQVYNGSSWRTVGELETNGVGGGNKNFDHSASYDISSDLVSAGTKQVRIITTEDGSLGGDWYDMPANAPDLEEVRITWSAGGGSGTSSDVADNFSATAYTNNDGATNWSGNWTESGDDGSASSTSGSAYIDYHSSYCPNSNDCLILNIANTSGTPSISRSVDLSSASSATLTFDYMKQSLSSGTVSLQVNPNSSGSNAWETLRTYSGSTTSGFESISLASHLASNTQIRFIITNDTGIGKFGIDNLQIEWAGSGGGLGASSDVADNFSATAYTNNDGATNWSGSWTEVSDGGSATGGAVRIESGSLKIGHEQSSAILGHNQEIKRSATIPSGLTSATLDLANVNFAFNGSSPSNYASDAPMVNVDIYDGTTWSTVATFSQTDNGTSPSIDILSNVNLTGDTQIRFLSSNSEPDWNGEASPGSADWAHEFTVSSVQITWVESTVAAGYISTAGSAPPVLTGSSTYTIPIGAFITTTYQVQVDNPIAGGILQFLNEAEVGSGQMEPVTDTATLPVTGVYDYGDLPNSYGTTSASSGASHQLDGSTYLGSSVDAESDGAPNDAAEGDDNASSPDDEDGIVFLTPIVASQPFTIQITAGTAGVLNAWIDYNANGTLTQIENESVLTQGIHTRSYTAPSNTTDNATIYSRFRFAASTGQVTGPTGTATSGEVEDYALLAIGDVVWLDLNADGVQDGGSEVGIPNVVVNLLDGSGIPVTDGNGNPITTTTDSSGNYGFGGLPEGDYMIELDPSNWNASNVFGTGGTYEGAVGSPGQGGDDQTNTDDNGNNDLGGSGTGIHSNVVTLSLGNEPNANSNADLTVDFGLFVPNEFGDLPDAYGTTLGAGGAGHVNTGAAFLGATVDSESDGTPSNAASGDGADEDGIQFLTPLTPDGKAVIQVTAAIDGYLNGWIDFDADGTLDNVNLAALNGVPLGGSITDLSLTAGTYTMTLIVPPSAVVDETIYSRFRFTSDDPAGALTSTGVWPNGEVEDYALMTLGDKVWYDVDNAGDQDGAEVAIPGVLVNLLDSSGNPMADADGNAIRTTTNVSGTYTFGGLPEGSYQVELDYSNWDVGGLFGSGGLYENAISTAGTGADGGDNTDDNGSNVSGPDGSTVTVTNTVRSGVIALNIGSENDVNGNGDLSIDFGLFVVQYDYGDLPNSYGTTDSQGGPRHLQTSVTYLGAGIDTEVDGIPTLDATGDDTYTTTNTITNDEDGVRFSVLSPGQTAIITVTAGTDGYLSGWIDFDADGTLDTVSVVSGAGAGGTLNDVNLTPDIYAIEISVPATATNSGTVYSRFRFTANAGEAPTANGTANNGEVEDYALGAIGNVVWYDRDTDGFQDDNEVGIGGVLINLLDSSGNPVLDSSGTAIQTTSNATGTYGFAGLPVGSYTIQVDPSNWNASNVFGAGGSYEDAYSVTGIGADDGNNTDDNGDNDSVVGPAGGVRSSIITLGLGSEPITDGDNDANTDLSIDFGFAFDSYDFGDLPNGSVSGPYNTASADGGPSHVIVGDVFLGNSIDADDDGQPSSGASNDDNDGRDDEDGVIFFTPLAPGRPAEVRVYANSDGYLSTFIDFDADGTLDQADYSSLDAVAVASTALNNVFLTVGWHVFYIDVPSDAATSSTMYSRFRFTSQNGGATTADGAAPSGEVEDYPLGSIGNLVWEDIDEDGFQDAGEPPIPGVIMELWGVRDAAGSYITTTTDINGEYYFGGLPEDSYVIQIHEDNWATGGVFAAGGSNENWVGTTGQGGDDQDDTDDNGDNDGGENLYSDPSILSTKITLTLGVNNGSYVVTPTVDTDYRDHSVDFGLTVYSALQATKSLRLPISGVARPGDPITFDLNIENTGYITVTQITLYDAYDTNVYEFSSATPSPTITSTGIVSWTGTIVDGVLQPYLPLKPGETLTVTVEFTAKEP